MGVLHTLPNARAARLAGSLLNRHSPQEIADAIEILIDVLDMLGGDPDVEDTEPDLEPDGDQADIAWPEWDQRSATDKRAGREMPPATAACQWHASTEDDEEDDPHGQCDEDGINTLLVLRTDRGAGCMISDEDFEIRGPSPSYSIDQSAPPSSQSAYRQHPLPASIPVSRGGHVV